MLGKQVLHILVVENDPVTASAITRVMTGLGWQVDFAASGRAAQKLNHEKEYDVVLLDVALPDIDGTQLCAQIKQQQPSPPVLFISATDNSVATLPQHPGDDIAPDVSDIKDIIARCQALASSAGLPVSA